MSRHEFDDTCDACKPCLADPKTMSPLPEDHPAQLAINTAWAESTLDQRQAFHNVTCSNSRDTGDLNTVEPLIGKMQELMAAATAKPVTMEGIVDIVEVPKESLH